MTVIKHTTPRFRHFLASLQFRGLRSSFSPSQSTMLEAVFSSLGPSAALASCDEDVLGGAVLAGEFIFSDQGNVVPAPLRRVP